MTIRKAIAGALVASALIGSTDAAAAVKPGTYKGETEQGKAVSLIVERALRGGARIERLKLSATLACPDGTTDDANESRLVIGGQVKKNGRFRIRMADLEIDGRFRSGGRVTGSFDLTGFTCSISGVGYSARTPR